MSGSTSEIRPGDVNPEQADRAARRIGEYLATHPDDGKPIQVRVEVGDDDPVFVPRPVAVILAQALAILAKGQGVHIMPNKAMLTTQQAADLLNVSRPYLIGLLEDGKIPYRMVGTHRRIAYEDLRKYKRKDLKHRRKVLDKLAELSEEFEEV